MGTDLKDTSRHSEISGTDIPDSGKTLSNDLRRREFRVATGFKGKEIHAHKTWEVPKKWRLLIQAEAVLFFIAMGAVIIGDVANLGIRFMVPAIISAVLIAVLAAVTMTVCVLQMNKRDKMDVRYYDVDYSENNLTGEVRDNTREVSKEAFFDRK